MTKLINLGRASTETRGTFYADHDFDAQPGPLVTCTHKSGQPSYPNLRRSTYTSGVPVTDPDYICVQQ